MVNFRNSSTDLIKKLPRCKGELLYNINISKYSRFKTGGNAEILFIPYDVNDLINFLRNTSQTIPINIIGLGSNILIRDGGVSGVTIVPININKIDVNIENQTIECGCFASSMVVSNIAKKNSISGFEFLYCIPGTIGGGVKMNAGCFGYDYSDITISIRTIDRNGNIKFYNSDECNFAYRSSNIPDSEIIVDVVLKGSIVKEITPIIIDGKMKELINKKKLCQPINKLCAGSVFKNPDGNSAWKLIKDSGADKLIKGGAKISDKHANFIINFDNATSSDIEDLGEKVRHMVYEKTGIMLQWEIKILGNRQLDSSFF